MIAYVQKKQWVIYCFLNPCRVSYKKEQKQNGKWNTLYGLEHVHLFD